MSTQLDLVIKAKSEYDAAFRGLQKELDKTHEKTGKLSGAFKSLTSGGGVSGALAALGPAGVAAAAGIGAVTVAAGFAVRELGALAGKAEEWTNLAQITGLGVIEVQQLGAMLEDAGIPAETLSASMRKLHKEIADGGKELQKFGIDLASIKNLTPEEQLQAVAQSILNLSDANDRGAAAQAAFGRGGEALIPVLDKIAESSYKAGHALDEGEIRALTRLDDELDKAKRSWIDFKNESLGAIAKVINALDDFDDRTTGRIRNPVTETIADFEKRIARIVPAGTDLWTTLGFDKPSEAQKAAIKGLEEGAKAHEKAAKEAAKHATELRKLDFVLLGMKNDIDAATLSLEQHLSTFADLSKFVPLTTKEIEEFNEALGQGPEMDPDVILGPLRIAKAELDRMAPTFGNALRDGFKAGLEGLGDVILGAIQGGGDVASAIGAKIFGDVGSKLGDALAKSIGGTLGSTLGSLLGPIGTLVGSWLGGLFNDVATWFGNLFGGKSEVDKARDAFFSQWEDGFVGVQRALLGTMGQVENEDWVKELFDARSMEELEAVIAKIREAIASIAQDVPPVHVPVTYGSEGAPVPEPEGMAHGGVVLPFVPRAARGIVGARPGGTLVRVGEGGQAELVAPVRAILENAARIGAAAAAARGDGEGAIILDGEVLGRWFTRRNKAGLLPVMVR